MIGGHLFRVCSTITNWVKHLINPHRKRKRDISLKRQYRIRAGKMEFMIESALTVHDDILQKELSANADDKMKNIVATIQREQNRIIRNEEARTLIIQV